MVRLDAQPWSIFDPISKALLPEVAEINLPQNEEINIP
jgi:hypothetical protein